MSGHLPWEVSMVLAWAATISLGLWHSHALRKGLCWQPRRAWVTGMHEGVGCCPCSCKNPLRTCLGAGKGTLRAPHP